MHELSLSSAIVETVVKHAAGREVTLVEMRIGTMRQVVPDSLEFYFGVVSRGTVCEGAALEVETVQAKLACKQCGTEWEIDLPDFRCPSCSATDVEVLCGTEFEVESIDVNEEEEAECIAPR